MLDDATAVRRRDPGGMLRHVAAFGDQLRSGWEISRGIELVDNHTKATAVAVLGMGGSAMCADLVRAVFSDSLTVPIVSVRDYDLPAWVGQRTLVVAVSHSGATEETISALSAALERRSAVVVITTGGPIGAVAERVKLPRLIYPDQTPPRASLGYTFALLTGLLERAGMLELTWNDMELAIEASATVVKACAPEVDTAENIAKQIAWAMLDRLPAIQASGALAAVARRWKTQLNENANSAAIAEELPEATHNAVVGYDQPDILHDHQHVVFLQSASDHPRNAYRAKLSAELLDAVRIGHQSVTVEGHTRLAEACAAVTLGDYVSVYLGLLYGMDPSATPALTTVKSRMAEFGKDAEVTDDDEEADQAD